ncbi:MAG: hypothetical protein ABN482_14255, partial [Corticimicrobacter sp.]|uniref:hypothetical protein n=1 Tax=Corticimicrobacter sp. TaxID=2678536 RepID=UPI0032DAFEE3
MSSAVRSTAMLSPVSVWPVRARHRIQSATEAVAVAAAPRRRASVARVSVWRRCTQAVVRHRIEIVDTGLALFGVAMIPLVCWVGYAAGF